MHFRISIYLVVIVLGISLNAQNSFKFKLTDSLQFVGTSIEYEIEVNQQETPSLVKLEFLDANNQQVLKQLIWIDQDPFNGCVEIPSYLLTGTYYFIATNETSKFMLGQGLVHVLNSRTFSKEQSDSENSIPSKLQIDSFKENPLEIQGKVNNRTKSSLIILQIRGPKDDFIYKPVNEDGSFSITTPLFGDSEILFSHHNGTSLESDVKIEYLPYAIRDINKSVTPYSLPSRFILNDDLNQLIVDNVFNLKSRLTDSISYSSIKYDKTLLLSDYFEQRSMVDIINEIVPLKRFRVKDENKSLYLLNTETNQYFKVEPLFLVDGFIVSTLKEILEMDPEVVDKISLSYSSKTNQDILGRFGSAGVFSINTKNGNYVPNKFSEIKIKGISIQKCD